MKTIRSLLLAGMFALAGLIVYNHGKITAYAECLEAMTENKD